MQIYAGHGAGQRSSLAESFAPESRLVWEPVFYASKLPGLLLLKGKRLKVLGDPDTGTVFVMLYGRVCGCVCVAIKYIFNFGVYSNEFKSSAEFWASEQRKAGWRFLANYRPKKVRRLHPSSVATLPKPYTRNG